MKVAYLSGNHLATSSISMMLAECFGKENVHQLPFDEIGTVHEKDFDLLILPGITGESSPYPSRIGEQERASLHKAVSENGMILWTDCAATYLMCNTIEYKASTGEFKTIRGLGFIDGVARGPVGGKAIAPSPEDRFHDVVIRRIEYKNGKKADLCYGNGPGLFLTEQERNNTDVDIIGHYHDVKDKPVAALTKRIGNGLLISLGVLVQISADHIRGRYTDKNAETHRSALFNHLSVTNQQREDFLNILLTTALAHKAAQHILTTGNRYDESNPHYWGRSGGIRSSMAGGYPWRDSDTARDAPAPQNGCA